MNIRKLYTWQGHFNFKYVIDHLTTPAKTTLRDALDNTCYIKCSDSTARSLQSLSLCDDDRRLTYEGKVLAIELSSLEQQAKVLSLPINEITLSYETSVERSVRIYLLDFCNYRRACYSEGGDIGTLLSCMCFDVIREAWDVFYKTQPGYRDSYKLDGQRVVDDRIKGVMYSSPLGSVNLLNLMLNKPQRRQKLEKAMLNSIAIVQKPDIERAFITMKQWQRRQGQVGRLRYGLGKDKWPLAKLVGLNLPFLTSLYDILGNTVLYNIAKTCFDCARCLSWPDITAIDKDNNIRLFEVKTSDKLFASQIMAISEMGKYFRIEIIRVKKDRNLKPFVLRP